MSRLWGLRMDHARIGYLTLYLIPCNPNEGIVRAAFEGLISNPGSGTWTLEGKPPERKLRNQAARVPTAEAESPVRLHKLLAGLGFYKGRPVWCIRRLEPAVCASPSQAGCVECEKDRPQNPSPRQLQSFVTRAWAVTSTTF